MGKCTTEPRMRPSAIGHFFSRIGSMRHRSKSPQVKVPSLCVSDDSVILCPTQPTSPTSSAKNVRIRSFEKNYLTDVGKYTSRHVIFKHMINYNKKYVI